LGLAAAGLSVSPWATPKAQDAKHAGASAGEDCRDAPGLWHQAGLWATPTQANHDQGCDTDSSREGSASLVGQASMWGTPTGMEPGGIAEQGVERKRKALAKGKKLGLCVSILDHQTELWVTPKANERAGQQTNSGGQAHLDVQANGFAASAWPTPGANDHKGACKPNQRVHQLDNAAEQIYPCFLPAPATGNSGAESSPPARGSRPRLNPVFVAWLMGWPLTAVGFSSYSGTASARYRRRMRSALSRLLSA
jgi:hypothetical protein